MVVLFGVLHIEMAATKTLCDWLQRGGWEYALVQADNALFPKGVAKFRYDVDKGGHYGHDDVCPLASPVLLPISELFYGPDNFWSGNHPTTQDTWFVTEAECSIISVDPWMRYYVHAPGRLGSKRTRSSYSVQ